MKDFLKLIEIFNEEASLEELGFHFVEENGGVLTYERILAQKKEYINVIFIITGYYGGFSKKKKFEGLGLYISFNAIEDIYYPIVSKYESLVSQYTMSVTMYEEGLHALIKKQNNFVELSTEEEVRSLARSIRKTIEEDIQMYFEKYQSVQDINTKIFPYLPMMKAITLKKYAQPFLANYSNEKALITLKLCNNSDFHLFYEWFKLTLNSEYKKAPDKWAVRIKIFKDLDEQFLSKEI